MTLLRLRSGTEFTLYFRTFRLSTLNLQLLRQFKSHHLPEAQVFFGMEMTLLKGIKPQTLHHQTSSTGANVKLRSQFAKLVRTTLMLRPKRSGAFKITLKARAYSSNIPLLTLIPTQSSSKRKWSKLCGIGLADDFWKATEFTFGVLKAQARLNMVMVGKDECAPELQLL